MLKVSAILLAAGLSRRMGGDKLLLEYRGRSLLMHSIDLLDNLPVHERILVTSDARTEFIALPSGVRMLVNHFPENGQSKSIHIGIESATGTHYLFLTADQPGLKLEDLMPLLEAAESNADKIVFPVIDGKPSSPALFPRRFRSELLNLSGDTGGRIVRDANPEMCFVIEPENPKNFMDIDSVEDYDDFISC